jgi:hypothetical protein
MNIVEAIEQLDRLHWETDKDGWSYISESTRIGWELARIVSAIYEEPDMWEEYRRTYYIGLSGLVKLADVYGIDVEIGDGWIRFGPSGHSPMLMTVNFTTLGDAFGWKATVEKALG